MKILNENELIGSSLATPRNLSSSSEAAADEKPAHLRKGTRTQPSLLPPPPTMTTLPELDLLTKMKTEAFNPGQIELAPLTLKINEKLYHVLKYFSISINRCSKSLNQY